MPLYTTTALHHYPILIYPTARSIPPHDTTATALHDVTAPHRRDAAVRRVAAFGGGALGRERAARGNRHVF